MTFFFSFFYDLIGNFLFWCVCACVCVFCNFDVVINRRSTINQFDELDRWIIERARQEQNAPGRDGSDTSWHSKYVKSRRRHTYTHRKQTFNTYFARWGMKSWILMKKKTQKRQSIPIIAIKFKKDMKSFLLNESTSRGIPRTSKTFHLIKVFFTIFKKVLHLFATNSRLSFN